MNKLRQNREKRKTPMRTCLIYGHDGLDIDVVHNLRAMYRELGFSVVYSSTLIRADLLVVHRAPEGRLDLSRYKSVHVWDYVGTSITEFLRGCTHLTDLHIFASSDPRLEQLRAEVPEVGDRIRVTLPPVAPELWIAGDASVDFDYVHIGNYKASYMHDPCSERFLTELERLNADVWGSGWPKNGRFKLHGPAKRRQVSAIYSRSRVALGQMYPFQRNLTLSGRFWHAPLNGCILVSEPSHYSDQVPGVVVGTADSVQAVTRQSITESATKFWAQHYAAVREELISIVEPTREAATAGGKPTHAKLLLQNAAKDFLRD